MPTYTIKSPFDIASRQDAKHSYRYDVVMADRLTQCVSRFESGAKYYGRNTHLFDAINITAANATTVHFVSEGRGLCKNAAFYDAVALFEHPTAGVTAKFEWTRSFDTGVKGRFEAIRPSFQQISNPFDAILYLKYVATAGMFDAHSVFLKKLTDSFDVMPGYQNTVTVGRFDAFGSVMTAISRHHQAFVKPGWRILIRNVATNEKRDLGFIEFDAVEKAIKDVDLSDGDYEITLLYSSLFWKDAIDRVVRNVTIRSDEDPVPGLPPILNLRSEVEDGVTRILWDSETGFDDCTFGLWFAETPPVVVMREPDQTVAYTASDVEYGVNITQSNPLWCVVMAIKGNMRGAASEIFLQWETSLPRRPDDQMAFDVYLDEKLDQLRNATGKDDAENNEWNTESGYW